MPPTLQVWFDLTAHSDQFPWLKNRIGLRSMMRKPTGGSGRTFAASPREDRVGHMPLTLQVWFDLT